MMNWFEKIHKNHFWAFVDGLGCGLVAAYFYKRINEDIQDLRRNPVKDLLDNPGTATKVTDLQEYVDRR